MKKTLLILLIIFTLNVYSQDKGFGVGVIIGEPTGISLKNWLNTKNAIDAGFSWTLYKPALHIHVDYLWHSYNVFNTKERIPLYYGVGGRIKFGNKDDARIGLRGVIGVDFFVRNAPIDIFIEIAPIFDLIPSTSMSGNGGLGIRYFFN